MTYDMFHFTGVIENVKLHIDLSVTYLDDFILSRSYKPWNAFFSGSMKGKEVMFFCYCVYLYTKCIKTMSFMF